MIFGKKLWMFEVIDRLIGRFIARDLQQNHDFGASVTIQNTEFASCKNRLSVEGLLF